MSNTVTNFIIHSVYSTEDTKAITGSLTVDIKALTNFLNYCGYALPNKLKTMPLLICWFLNTET